MLERLFSWEVTGWIVGLVEALAFTFVGLADFKLARISFLIVAADASGGLIVWGMNSTRPAFVAYAVVFLGVGCVGILTLAALRYVNRKEAKEVAKSPAAPKLEIGMILGADKGIGTDAVVDCSKPIYKCLTEEQTKSTPLIFDLGSKGWARVVFQMKNIGETKLQNSATNIQSPNPISIDFAPRPDPSRLPRNVLDIYDPNGIVPYSISKANTDIPLDIVVPSGINEFDLYLNSFGDNMVAEKRVYHFSVRRQALRSKAPIKSHKAEPVGALPTEFNPFANMKSYSAEELRPLPSWPNVLLDWRWPERKDSAIANARTVMHRHFSLRSPDGRIVYNVSIADIDLGNYVAKFHTFPHISDKPELLYPVIYKKDGEIDNTHDLESCLGHTGEPRKMYRGNDESSLKIPIVICCEDNLNERYEIAYSLHYDLWSRSAAASRVGIRKVI